MDMGMRSTLILVFIGCLAQTGCCLASLELASLCNNQPLQLPKISDVVSLIQQASDGPSGGCSRKVIDALKDLKPILTENMNDVCSVDRASQIVSFHKRYISKSSWRLKGATLPATLERFVLAFGLKVGGICQQSMLESLIEDSQKQLTGADFEIFKTENGSLLDSMSSELKGYEDIVLISEVARRRRNKERAYLQTALHKQTKRIQMACERRFEPFYRDRVLPFAILSTAGYGLKGKSDMQELEKLKSDDVVSAWFHIALLCETFAQVETFEVSEGNKKQMRILKSSEAEELRQKQTSQAARIGQDIGPQVSYVPVNAHTVDDVIVEDGDAILSDRVNTFKANRAEMKRIRRKALRRVASMLKRMLLSNHEISLISSLFKSHKPDNNLDFIEAVDEEISHEEGEDEGEIEGALIRHKRKLQTVGEIRGEQFMDFLKVVAIFVVIGCIVALGIHFGG